MKAISSLRVYADRRIVAIFFLGFSSGLPLALTAATLMIWLSRAGVDKTTVGIFASVATPYLLKFAWAPAIDRIRVPLLTSWLGRRRGWMVTTQIALIAAILAMASVDPAVSPGLMALCAFVVAFCSASQDIVIDAYRVEVLEEKKLGAGAATVVFGYRVGMLVSGAGALYLAEDLPWALVYAVMAAFVLVGTVTILLSPEPDPGEARAGLAAARRRDGTVAGFLRARAGLADRLAGSIGRFLGTMFGPLLEFFKRPMWPVVLGFIVLYKFGDSLAGVMTPTFMVELGFSNTEIANVGKIYGFAAIMLGLFVGGWLINAVGILGSLWVCGFLQMGSNLLFAVQAAVGHDTAMLALTVGVENLASGMGTAAFVAYLSSLCNVAYTATQYALLSSLMAFARTIFSTPSGWLAEMLDWIPFFVLTTIAAVPGLVLLFFLARASRRLEPVRIEAGAGPPADRGGGSAAQG